VAAKGPPALRLVRPAKRSLTCTDGERAEEYGVGHNTVRLAIAELRDRGLVITLRGHGNYVARAKSVGSASAG
jgi:DNA-binding FadR family transcriptional regulator